MGQIPAQIDEVFQELRDEVTWLYVRWIIYRQLFAASERRIDLLNESASVFFYVIQDVLFWEVQIALSKLTDPARIGRYDNLSLEQLQIRVETHGDLQFAAKLRVLLDELHTKCQYFRAHRNKRLAHFDLTTAMQSTSNPLPGVSMQMIQQALDLLCEYMNTIERHYTETETGYENFIMHSGGNELVSLLKFGLRYEELLRDGQISWEDINQSQWKDA